MHPVHSRKILTWICVCLLVLAGLGSMARAEDSVHLDGIGIRYYHAEGETFLTRDQLPEDALALLGADEGTALEAMLRDDLYLICFSPDGGQVSLSVTDKPAGLSSQSVFQMETTEKEQFLTLLARSGQYLSATWTNSAPGYALFSTYGTEEAAGAGMLHTLSLSTLYLGKIYSFQTDLIGRAPTQEDIDLLTQAANRALLLGAATKSGDEENPENAALSLPELPTLSTEPAPITTDRSDLPLSLDPIPSTIGATTLTLSGTTEPKAYVRYAVDGKASSRFQVDESGAFTVTVPRLNADADNLIEVTAFTKAGETSVVHFTVRVDWQSSPLVLSQTGGTAHGERMQLRGLTLPGSKVQLIRKQETVQVVVGEDGSFVTNVLLKKIGENTFTIRCTAPGYRRVDTVVTVTRLVTAADELKALQKTVKTVKYAKLKENPAAYEGRTVLYQGKVTALSNENGQPAFLLATPENEILVCLCADLLAVEFGQEMKLIGTLTGDTHTLNTRWETGVYPALEVTAILP